MAPDLQEFFRVMSSGRLQSCVRPSVRSYMTAGLDGFREIEALSVGRDRNPAEAVRFLSIRRVTDLPSRVFTLASLRHAAAQQVMLSLLRVGRCPVCS